MAEDLKLFRTWSSPWAVRVEQALKIKGLDFEPHFEYLKNKSAALLEYNPVYKKIPVLLHNGNPICEPYVILKYIDEVWLQPPLLPQHPYDKAMARVWAKFGDEKVQTLARRVLNSQGKDQEEALVELCENLRFLEEELKGKKLFGGEKIGYLDLALGWMANLIDIFEEITELKLLEAKKFPLLSAWINNFADDPVMKETWPPRDKMIDKFKAMPTKPSNQLSKN